jgi:hypothetical protein
MCPLLCIGKLVQHHLNASFASLFQCWDHVRVAGYYKQSIVCFFVCNVTDINSEAHIYAFLFEISLEIRVVVLPAVLRMLLERPASEFKLPKPYGE